MNGNVRTVSLADVTVRMRAHTHTFSHQTLFARNYWGVHCSLWCSAHCVCVCVFVADEPKQVAISSHGFSGDFQRT